MSEDDAEVVMPTGHFAARRSEDLLGRDSTIKAYNIKCQRHVQKVAFGRSAKKKKKANNNVGKACVIRCRRPAAWPLSTNKRNKKHNLQAQTNPVGHTI